MKRTSILFLAFIFITLDACNLLEYPSITAIKPPENTFIQPTGITEFPSATIEPVVTLIYQSPENFPTYTPTATTVYSPTLSPTPTIVPPERCPPFTIDPLPSNISWLTDPSVLIGKHFKPGAGKEFLFLATELDPLSHFIVIYSLKTGKLVWIERFICWDTNGIAYFEVKDAVLLKPFSSDQSISLDCWLEDKNIYYALAVGSVDMNKEPVSYNDNFGWLYNRLDYGYFVDTNQEKIISVSVKEWICMHPCGPGDICQRQ